MIRPLLCLCLYVQIASVLAAPPLRGTTDQSQLTVNVNITADGAPTLFLILPR